MACQWGIELPLDVPTPGSCDDLTTVQLPKATAQLILSTHKIGTVITTNVLDMTSTRNESNETIDKGIRGQVLKLL